MKILGISAFYHDSAAALVIDDDLIAAAQEERFTRKKHTSEFPVEAISYCLEEGGLEIDELDAVVFYDKPLLKFERLLETYLAFVPKGLLSYIKAMPVWLREKIFLKKLIYEGLNKVGEYNRREIKLLFSEHHLAHAASAFYPSPFIDAAILTIDGVGEWTTASIGKGEGNKIRLLKEMHFPHSVGLLYSAFTYYLGFKVNSGEYKLMGLAPYGDPGSEQTKGFRMAITEKLVDIKQDGSIWLNQEYFNYATGLRMVKDRKWEQLFGFPRRHAEEELMQHHCNMAFAIQEVTEEIVLRMARHARELTGSARLCMAGGVALNCVANGKIIKEKLFDDIYIQPAAGDAGGALGAALAALHLHFKRERVMSEVKDTMKGAYLGPSFSDREVEKFNRKMKASYTLYDSYSNLTKEVAALIAAGKVVGWFRGRMEFGPRALGNRSILGDARNPDMQKRLNLKIKQREGFRPFAPSVLEEDIHEYFDLAMPSPYMLMVAPIKETRRQHLPADYHTKSLWEKLYFQRSDIQAVTHLDFSARIQSVNKETNPDYWQLINAFKEITGYGIIVNTSFNVRGEPIVCSPEDAYRCFMGTEMDALVMNNYLYIKDQQPDQLDKSKWKTNFEKD